MQKCLSASICFRSSISNGRTNGALAARQKRFTSPMTRYYSIFFFVFFLFGFRFYLLKCHNRCFTCFMMNMIDAWWQHLLKSPFVRLHVYLLLYLHSMFAALARPFNKNKTRAELLWRRREKKNTIIMHRFILQTKDDKKKTTTTINWLLFGGLATFWPSIAFHRCMKEPLFDCFLAGFDMG